jgi:protein-disulfide isomerase
MQLRTSFGFLTLALAGSVAWSQTAPVPQAPAPQASTPQASAGPAEPSGPVSFPPVDPANFTATSPTRQTVEDFLHAFWGYDASRVWQVQAILPTQAPGVSRVLVLVKAAAPQAKDKDQIAQLSFFTLPDGKWLVADQLLPFGSKPFENYREILKANASGPSKGAAAKDLELVEFSDFECPHCKDAQPTLQKLLADYPSAHFVHQDFPLVQIHPEALKAALHGYCVTKAGGNDAFFKYSDAVFATQSGLTPTTADETLKEAETKAGQDPAKIAACAATPEAKAAVDTSRALGERVGVNQTPTLFVNGRALPINGIPYEMLQKIIAFQANLDGVSLPPPPTAKPAPSLK